MASPGIGKARGIEEPGCMASDATVAVSFLSAPAAPCPSVPRDWQLLTTERDDSRAGGFNRRWIPDLRRILRLRAFRSNRNSTRNAATRRCRLTRRHCCACLSIERVKTAFPIIQRCNSRRAGVTRLNRRRTGKKRNWPATTIPTRAARPARHCS